MTDYGIKVTRAGHDVATAGILDQEFNSEKNCLKIAFPGSGSSNASGNRTVEVPHSLGFVPAFLLWWKVGSGKLYFNKETEFVSGNSAHAEGYTDSTKLYVDIYTSGSANVTFYYLIMADAAM